MHGNKHDIAYSNCSIDFKNKTMIIMDLQNAISGKSPMNLGLQENVKRFYEKHKKEYSSWKEALIHSMINYAKKRKLKVFITTPQHHKNIWNSANSGTLKKIYERNIKKIAKNNNWTTNKVSINSFNEATQKAIQDNYLLQIQY